MDDSFLDEIEIVQPEEQPKSSQRQIDQFITLERSRATSKSRKNDAKDIPMDCQENVDSNTNSILKGRNHESLKISKSHVLKRNEIKKHNTGGENEVLLEQNRVRNDYKTGVKESKLTDIAHKRSKESRENNDKQSGKILNKRETSKNENFNLKSPTIQTGTLEVSNDEISTLPDLSKEKYSESDTNPIGISATSSKLEVNDPLALLNAIKTLVSTYSKIETSKILRIMQELHINSQANLIKHLLIQTDDLTREMHPGRDESRLKQLIEENQRMREDILILKLRNEELQKKVDESILIKEENIALKLKIKELTKSRS